MRIIFLFLLFISVSNADFVKKNDLKRLDVLNHYTRKRLLIGISTGFNFNSFETSSYISPNAVNDGNQSLKEFLIAEGVDDLYGKGDDQSLEFGIWLDYWMYRHWGVISELGYRKLTAGNDGSITLRRTDKNYNVATTVSQDDYQYELSQVYFTFSPKFTFYNIYLYSGGEISYLLNSEFDFYSLLISGDTYGEPAQFYEDDTNGRSFTRKINEEIEDLNSVNFSIIAGIGGYFPITKKIWVVPELKINKWITSPFSSKIKNELTLLDENKTEEEKRILRMNEPETKWMSYSFKLNIVYRF